MFAVEDIEDVLARLQSPSGSFGLLAGGSRSELLGRGRTNGILHHPLPLAAFPYRRSWKWTYSIDG